LNNINQDSGKSEAKLVAEEFQWKMVYTFMLAQFVFIPAVLYWFTKVFE